MKAGRILGITTIIVYVLIILFIVSMIYPFPMHQIDIMESGGYHFYSKGNLTAGTYINMVNRGPYPISDLVLKYSIYNSTVPVSQDTLYLGNVIGNTTLNISMKINILKLVEIPVLNYLLFHSSNLTLKLNLYGKYAYGFISFFMSGNITMYWERLAGFSFGTYYYTQNSTNFTIHVPFYFSSAPFLSGNFTLISKMLLNGSQINEARTTVPLGVNYTGELVFNFPLSEAPYIQGNSKYIKLDNSALIYNHTIELGVA